MTVAKGLTERIERLIEVAGSQNDFARAAGVSSAAVTNWRRGVIPYKSTLHDVAEKLGVSLNWLVQGQGDSKHELETFRGRLRASAPGRKLGHHTRMISDTSSQGGYEEEPGRSGTDTTAALLSLETLTRIIREIRLNENISAEERLRRSQPYQEELERRLSTKP